MNGPGECAAWVQACSQVSHLTLDAKCQCEINQLVCMEKAVEISGCKDEIGSMMSGDRDITNRKLASLGCTGPHSEVPINPEAPSQGPPPMPASFISGIS